MTCVLVLLKGEFPFSEGYFLRLPAPLWLCVALCGATGHVRFLFLPALDEASMCIHLGRQAGTCPSIAHTHRQNRQCPEKVRLRMLEVPILCRFGIAEKQFRLHHFTQMGHCLFRF